MTAPLDPATDLILALDPVVLARRVGLEPDPWQVDVLRSTAPRLLLNCSRQSGKSTITAVLACHVALYEPGALVILLSPSQRQSGELLRKVLDVYHAADAGIETVQESATTLALANGSRIVSLPGKEATVRGYSGVRLLIVDEASRVPDELVSAVRPMLAVSGGRLIALSTPYGRRGWWFTAWQYSGDGWQRIEVPAEQCPRISPDFLVDERRALGRWWFEQEYHCAFLDSADAVFREADVRACFDDERTESRWLLAGLDLDEEAA